MQTPFNIIVKLKRLYYPAYELRVEANKHFAAQEWNEGATKYEKAIGMMEKNQERARYFFKNDSLSELTVDRAMALWDMHVTRMISNLCCCYMHQAVASACIPTDVNVVITAGSPILAQIRHLGVEKVRNDSNRLFKKAEELLYSIPAHGQAWWKIHYRRAQLLQLIVEPHNAMKEIELGRHFAKVPSLLYNRDTESEAALRQLDILSKEIEKVLLHLDKDYFARQTKQDGKPQGVLSAYLQANLTPLPSNHPRIPMSALREEMLAVRLLAANEVAAPVIRTFQDGTPVRPDEVKLNPKKESTRLLNEILSIVSQPPLNLFPASGSDERVPPISAHLLAFYFRACLTDKAMKELGIDKFCEQVTGDWLSDEIVYAVATHGFVEVENAHNPKKGHAKKLGQTGAGGCMPCSFRLLRSGHDEWGDGLRQAAHFGRIEWIAFCLNRLICGIDDKSVEETILETDVAGCNAMMHAANDNFSGYSGLTTRLLVQAASFSASDFDDKTRTIRRVLNTTDRHGFTPALASISLGNASGISAFVTLGARLWDESVNKNMSSTEMAMVKAAIDRIGSGSDTRLNSAIRAIQTRSNEKEPCSFCGNPPKQGMERLLYCGRCNRTGYCSKECQKKAYKKHKFVCTTAKVEEDGAFYESNISVPKP